MRKLSEQELDKVKKAIAAKELTSAEILMEIYDHYVSHLESFEESKLQDELFELEQKFNYSYCRALQAKFIKASKKEMLNLQWSIFKTYFTWPRMLASATFLIFLLTLWGNIESRTKGLSLILPLVLIILMTAWIYFISYRKVTKIKKMIPSEKRIESSYLSNIMMQLSLLMSTFNLIILVPKILDFPNFLDSNFFLVASFSLFIIYTGYTLTLFEAWKIKSKTSLI